LREWLVPVTETLVWVEDGEEKSVAVECDSVEAEAAGNVVADLVILHLKWLRAQFKDPKQP
jgi:hypothetical protein